MGKGQLWPTRACRQCGYEYSDIGAPRGQDPSLCGACRDPLPWGYDGDTRRDLVNQIIKAYEEAEKEEGHNEREE